MNKIIRNYLFLILTGTILITVMGCKDDRVDSHQIYGSGKIVSQTRSVNSFTGILVGGIASVDITPSETELLRLEADDNIINKITTKVEGGKLKIVLEKGNYSNITVRAHVSMKTLAELNCDGTADFTTVKPFNMDVFNCVINGTGSVNVSGTANKEIIDINGTGSIRNFGLQAAEAAVAINGAGNAEIYVTKKLDAVISGTGNITYDGNTAEVNQKISGVGSIHKR